MVLSPIQKRFIMFLLGCIPVRLFASWLAYYLSRNYKKGLKVLAGLAVLPVLGWLIIILFGLRKSGPETQGNPIWWNFMRPIHMLLYIIFIYLALSNKEKLQKKAWILLLIDALIGLIAFIIYHYIKGNFKKLITK
jgi:hypothetical protein